MKCRITQRNLCWDLGYLVDGTALETAGNNSAASRALQREGWSIVPSLPLSIALCLSPSLSLSLSLYLSFCLSLALLYSRSPSLPASLSLSLFLSPRLSLSLSLTLLCTSLTLFLHPSSSGEECSSASCHTGTACCIPKCRGMQPRF